MFESKDSMVPDRVDPFEAPFEPGVDGPAWRSQMAPVGGDAWLPMAVADGEPGMLTAIGVSALEADSLSAYDRVRLLVAHQRLVAHFQAALYRDMAALATVLDDGDTPCEAAAEVRAALTLTRRAADAEVSFAVDLDRRLPQVLDALASGSIDLRRARTIDRHTRDLEDHLAYEVVERVIHDAPNLTTGQLAARLRSLRTEVDPDQAASRYEAAVEGRRVVLEATPDGTANLFAYDLPPDRAVAAAAWIDAMARSHADPGDDRTMDQRRADVLLDLVDPPSAADARAGRLASDAGSARGSVDIVVDLGTLVGLGDEPGDLAGFGPVVADIARRVVARAGDAAWRYTVTDGGHVLDTGAIRRRPTAAQARWVTARDRRCVFPGCRMPAVTADLDHTKAWASGGHTDTDNLAPLCRHDHGLKTRFGWRYVRDADGAITWTSPLGHRYESAVLGGPSP